MVRYKRLGKDELAVLEKKFVEFLAAQNILADDWAKIKITEPEEAERIIDKFSDLVYGSVLNNAAFLEKRTRHALYCYQCLPDRFVLVALELDTNSDFDLRNSNTANIGTITSNGKMSVYTTNKFYTKSKAEEVFEMMKMGCEITDGVMFKVLGAQLI